MAEEDANDVGLDPDWYAFGARLAAGSAALFALISLNRDVPVPQAALRGLLALVAVRVTWWLGWRALRRALQADGVSATPLEEEGLESEPPEPSGVQE